MTEPHARNLGVAAGALIASGALLWQARRLPCPTDPVAAQSCTRLRRTSERLYGVALGAYGLGATFAFVLPRWMSAS